MKRTMHDVVRHEKQGWTELSVKAFCSPHWFINGHNAPRDNGKRKVGKKRFGK